MLSVKLRISHGTRRIRYALPVKEGIIVSRATYERLVIYHQTRHKRTSEDIRVVYALIAPHLDKAQQVISQLREFSFPAFESAFYSQSVAGDAGDVILTLQQKSKQMIAEGRIGNAANYQSAAQSLSAFITGLERKERVGLLGASIVEGAPLLRFSQLTPALLLRYEQWMLRAGNLITGKPASLTTVGIYLRHLRAIVNEAIAAGIVDRKDYPFGRKGYIIPAGRNIKKALKKEVIRQIMDYACVPGSLEERSRDLWLFSYLSNGMNLSDVCGLRWSNIDYQSRTIVIVRNKTSRSQKGNQVRIVATLFPESQAILERWGNKESAPNGYVFPFLKEDMDARRQKAVIAQLIKLTNKWINRIGQALGIDQEINTYQARHSFASALLKAGANVSFIGEKLGHSSLKSTESYLSTFEDEDTREMMRKSLL